MIYAITIVHTLGSEAITIEADCADDAIIQAREWALNEGLILLRCCLG